MLHDYIFFLERWTLIVSTTGILFLLYGFLICRRNLCGCDIAVKPIYYMFVIICLINIVIGIPLTIFDGRLYEILYNLQRLWMYLIGLAMLFTINIKNINQFINWTLLYTITSLIYIALFFSDLFFHPEILAFAVVTGDLRQLGMSQLPAMLLFPVGAFWIFYPFYSRRWRCSIIVAFILAFLACLLAGRRSFAVEILCYAFMPISLKLLIGGKKILFFVLLLFVIAIFSLSKYEEGYDSFFGDNLSVLAERIDADTRSGTEIDFYEDMDSPTDWIFGRGMSGRYKSHELEDIDDLYRTTIETGYLNIILHGGVLMLIPYLLILSYASYKGFFYSRSKYVKYFSLYIFFIFFGCIRMELHI